MKKNVGLVSKFTNLVSFVLANTHYAQQMHNQTFHRSFLYDEHLVLKQF